MGYHHIDGHFVDSLKTSNYEDAKFLALYIKRMIDKECSMEAKKMSYEPMGSGCFDEFTHSIAEIGNNLDVNRQRATVQKMLREKFKRLYQTGLQLIDEGYGHEPDQIITLSKEQKALLEQKIQNAKEHARSVIDQPTAREPVTLSVGNTGLNNKLGKAKDDIFFEQCQCSDAI